MNLIDRDAFFLINHPSINFDGSIIESTRYTEDQAANKAIEAWNRRVDNETD